MGKSIEFKPNVSGYFELMKSGPVKAELKKRAIKVGNSAANALAGDKGTPLRQDPYMATEFETSERAGMRIQTHNPHADYAEAKHGHLRNALGV